jgi:GNAT superfamily N-acetyltransferase
MFADTSLAARIDGAEARLSAAVAAAVADPQFTHVVPLEGGIAALARPGSPVNKIIGIALEGPPDEIALHAVEEAWKARGEPVRVELSSLADPEASLWLTSRGYKLHGFEHVCVRELSNLPAMPAMEIDRAPDLEQWLDVAVEGFAHGDGTGQVVDESTHDVVDDVLRDFVRAEGFQRYLARLDGHAAGAASLRFDSGVAIFSGAATLPRFRRRGVQASLLAARLHDARTAGCDLAVVTTAPGSMSQRNVEKHGFRLAYVRAILIRSWE